MEVSRLVSLIKQYADKTIQPADLDLLRNWFYSATPEELNRVLDQCGNLPQEFTELLKVPKEFAIHLENKLDALDHKPRTKIHFLKTNWLRYAAAVILILGLCTYLWNNFSKKETFHSTVASHHDINAPSKVTATITLADGRIISLDSSVNGKLAFQGNVSIEKTNDGRIIYAGVNQASVMYNTIHVPRGSKIANLTLADGTKVFLNSESSLKYPVAFVGNERHVEITGEAYLEVAKDTKKKFSVTGNGITTEVLGTHFNMNTYRDEEVGRVTLLEGSIKVTHLNQSILVKPGEQAVIDNEKIKINTNADVASVTAWKDGIFNFQHMGFASVMRQISRWYNVNIIYPKGVPSLELGGEIQKTFSLSEMLNALGILGVKYEINGNDLTILP